VCLPGYPLGISTWIVPDDTDGGSSPLARAAELSAAPKRLPEAVSDYCCFLPAAQQPFAIQLAPQEELVGIDGVPLSYPCYRCARLKGLLVS
jgi:hypothetical protein